MTPDLVVSRHRGAVEWLTKNLPEIPGVEHQWIVRRDGTGSWLDPVVPDYSRPFDVGGYHMLPVPGAAPIPIRAEVTADDVRGKHVVGNLPLHLAALSASVTAIEFAGPPPRGQEYTAADMTAAGARLAVYVVRAV